MKTFWQIITKSLFYALVLSFMGVGVVIVYVIYKILILMELSEPAAFSSAVGVFFFFVTAYAGMVVVEDKESSELKAIERSRADLEKREAELLEKSEKFEDKKKKTNAAYLMLIDEDKQTYPWMAGQFSDFMYLHDLKTADEMRNKAHPALSSAEKVSQIAKEKRELQKQLKMYEYQLNFLENLFPWLPDFEQVSVKDAVRYAQDTESDYDNMRDYLSPEEYSKLSSAEKSDLAIKRWKQRRHGAWEAGRDYERYIGYKFEIEGYKVEYVGALMKEEDRGIDLVAKNGSDIKVIQCKRYSAEKSHFVHENTVAQLFGVTAMYNMENPKCHAEGVIYTSSTLSREAKNFAEYLNIKVIENEKLIDYPLIKCNIGKGGEKIYHLPFDQQYDKINISGKKGSYYVRSAAEAERLGYRRAYRWKGN